MLLISCGGGTSSLSREEESFASSSVASNADSSAMPSSSASPATVHDLAPDYHDFVEKYMAKLSSFTSYQSVTKGSTKSKAFIIETTQSIDVTSIKGEYNYLKNESHGAVDTVHEAYFHDGNALVQNKDEAAFSKLSMKEYLDTYGVDPHGHNIEGYSIAEGAITSISKEEGEGYAYTLAFDVEKATTNVRIQMKTFGHLDDYPSFSSIHITIAVKEDFTPITYTVKASYKAKLFMESDCDQEYTVTFSQFDEKIEVPNLETIKSNYNF